MDLDKVVLDLENLYEKYPISVDKNVLANVMGRSYIRASSLPEADLILSFCPPESYQEFMGELEAYVKWEYEMSISSDIWDDL